MYFSTPDGVVNAFPQGLNNNQLSWEVRPASPGSGAYSTDYATYSNLAEFYYNRGLLSMTLPTTDSDGNGFPDFLQIDRSASSSVAGISSEFVWNGSSWINYGSHNFSLTFSRLSGASSGIFSGSDTDGSSFSGTFYLEGGSGSVVYDLSARTITFEGDSFSFDTSGSGTSTYSISSQNQVSVAAFNFDSSDGITRRIQPFVLNRTGNKYRANVALVDGDPRTPYVDYKDCRVEITDDNDWNSNGVPDLSDPPPAPAITSINRVGGVVGQPFNFQILTTGGPGSLPSMAVLPCPRCFPWIPVPA